MTVHPLTNERWGFASMCFACEASNPHGLRVPFFHDDVAGTVFAEFTLDETFSGPPALVHGGILMTLCDEAMGWACIVEAEAWAVTANNTHRFLRPVGVGRLHRVEARIAGRDHAGVHATATIARVGSGRLAVEVEALFVPLRPAQAAQVIGTEVPAEHRHFLADP